MSGTAIISRPARWQQWHELHPAASKVRERLACALRCSRCGVRRRSPTSICLVNGCPLVSLLGALLAAHQSNLCVFFPSILVDSPSDQGETCTSLCSVFRGLHFAAYFYVLLNQPGSHRRGRTLGLFSSFYFFFDAPPLPAVLAFIFYREKGSAVPFPRRQ